MKRALSLILALVLCLSLCACGGDNDKYAGGKNAKYAGTYERNTSIPPYYSSQNNYKARTELILKSDGTGSLITTYAQDVTVYNNMGGGELLFSAKIGDIYEELSLTWEVIDDCAVVEYSGTKYTVYGQQEDVSYSDTYELKANKLFYINSSNIAFTKK